MKRIKIFVLLCVFVLAMCAGAAADNNPFTNEKFNITSADNKMTIDLNNGTIPPTTQWVQSSGDVTIKNGTITTSLLDFFEVTGGTLTLGENLTVIAKTLCY